MPLPDTPLSPGVMVSCYRLDGAANRFGAMIDMTGLVRSLRIPSGENVVRDLDEGYVGCCYLYPMGRRTVLTARATTGWFRSRRRCGGRAR